MANFIGRILKRRASLDAIPLSKILLFKDLLNREIEQKSFEEQESGENPCGPGSSDSWHERLWIRIQELFGY